MSWDVLVFNCNGEPPENVTGGLFKDRQPDPLGPATAVRESISAALPGVDWSDPTWGLFMGNGFSFEFNTGSNDPIDCIMVHVRGGGDAVTSLLQFAVPNNWSLLDCSTSEFIDPHNPSEAGWEGFQSFRDKIVGKNRKQTKPKPKRKKS